MKHFINQAENLAILKIKPNVMREDIYILFKFRGKSVQLEDGYYCQFGAVLETFRGVSEKQHQ